MTDLDKLEALAKADAVQEVCDLLENMSGADDVTDALYVSFNGVVRHWRDAMNDAADLLQASARRDAEEIERLKRELAAADGRMADYRTVATRAAHTGEGPMPERVQLKRTKGWRMPENTVKVCRGRGMRWGNPFDLRREAHCWTALALGFRADKAGRRAASVELFRRWIEAGKPGAAQGGLGAKVGGDGEIEAIVSSPLIVAPAPPSKAEIREHLAGKNLACWCPLDGQPCHADVLLELANQPEEQP